VRSYHIPVHNVKTTLSPIPKPQKGGPRSPLSFPLKTQQNIHGALVQTRRTRPWMCRNAYAHVGPGKGQPESLTCLVRLPWIPRNSTVAKMTHQSWLTPSDHCSVIQMMCIDCGAVSDDTSLLCITKHPWTLLTPLVGILLSSRWLYCWSPCDPIDYFVYCLVLVTWPVAQHVYIACGMRMDRPQTVHLSSQVQALYSPGSIRYPSSSGPRPSPPLATPACHPCLVGQFHCLALAFTQPCLLCPQPWRESLIVHQWVLHMHHVLRSLLPTPCGHSAGRPCTVSCCTCTVGHTCAMCRPCTMAHLFCHSVMSHLPLPAPCGHATGCTCAVGRSCTVLCCSCAVGCHPHCVLPPPTVWTMHCTVHCPCRVSHHVLHLRYVLCCAMQCVVSCCTMCCTAHRPYHLCVAPFVAHAVCWAAATHAIHHAMCHIVSLLMPAHPPVHNLISKKNKEVTYCHWVPWLRSGEEVKVDKEWVTCYMMQQQPDYVTQEWQPRNRNHCNNKLNKLHKITNIFM